MSGVSLLLRSSSTRLPALNADSDATVETGGVTVAAEEDDDNVDLFGEETEEEKKVAEERAASIKASAKKKESGKSSVLMDLKPWDDETDMKKLEEAVRSVQMEGKNFEKWDSLNCMSLMIIKRGIPEAFRGAVFEKITKAKEFLTEIEKRFVKNDKAETSTLLQNLISMKYNKVWELVPLPEGAKPIGCKWIFKTKRDSKGNVERYKARLVAKGFTQKEGIDFKETFSPVSMKDYFRTIMALVAHFDLELHQMDVKTAFLNGDIDETIYMVQPENFESGDSKNMVCKLTKSIYGLKQASRQWYHKFHQVIISFGFEINAIDNCVYHKFNGSKHIFLVLYVDDILLATNDIGMLHETKRFLSKNFEMKDLGDASFVLGIQI
ncbi:hypothetical protein LWI29_012854 [Acer saccharum]|uniref:Reverse transcriptase Ty1/copia-type domain-containing protein n=1 Tax=Acer saccharum TaxID=4024 RepID=A0AA39VIS7_ACESA|nr:hypothetical protein LWI29_012854 [Acer saccharum]